MKLAGNLEPTGTGLDQTIFFTGGHRPGNRPGLAEPGREPAGDPAGGGIRHPGQAQARRRCPHRRLADIPGCPGRCPDSQPAALRHFPAADAGPAGGGAGHTGPGLGAGGGAYRADILHVGQRAPATDGRAAGARGDELVRADGRSWPRVRCWPWPRPRSARLPAFSAFICFNITSPAPSKCLSFSRRSLLWRAFSWSAWRPPGSSSCSGRSSLQ